MRRRIFYLNEDKQRASILSPGKIELDLSSLRDVIEKLRDHIRINGWRILQSSIDNSNNLHLECEWIESGKDPKITIKIQRDFRLLKGYVSDFKISVSKCKDDYAMGLLGYCKQIEKAIKSLEGIEPAYEDFIKGLNDMI